MVDRPVWFKSYSLGDLQGFRNANMGAHIGLEFTEIGPDSLSAKMPVDHRTTQPFGLLHGGASCVLSETLGSVAAWMCIDPDTFMVNGVEINASHLRPAREGFVLGDCRPVRIGRRLHVWQTDITHQETGKQICSSRLTVAVIERT